MEGRPGLEETATPPIEKQVSTVGEGVFLGSGNPEKEPLVDIRRLGLGIISGEGVLHQPLHRPRPGLNGVALQKLDVKEALHGLDHGALPAAVSALAFEYSLKDSFGGRAVTPVFGLQDLAANIEGIRGGTVAKDQERIVSQLKHRFRSVLEA